MYSQSGQDMFVSKLLNKNNGTFLDIGAGHPLNFNNTCLLEREYKWTGLSIDINEKFKALWEQERINTFRCLNALKVDYNELFKQYYKEDIIDYLSLDIDEKYVDVLKLLPFDEYKFRVITIEHDYYIHGELYRKEEREFLSKRGYHLLCSNVKNSGNMYEDWWVHPDLVEDYKYLSCDALDYIDILKRMEGISVLIFSKDRSMQLHALLQSIECYSTIYDDITILYTCSDSDFEKGYNLLQSRFKRYNFIKETTFENDVRNYINLVTTKFISFLVDDILFFNHVHKEKIVTFLNKPKTITFILGVGTNIKFSNTAAIEFDLPEFTIDENGVYTWNWKMIKNNSEFACPLMVMGNVFNSTQFMKWLNKIKIKFINPNYFEEMLQYILQNQYKKILPDLCGSFKTSCVVHSSNNRVQNTHLNLYGQVFNYLPEDLNKMYLDGYIIDINNYQFDKICGLHHELDLKFKMYNS